MAVLIDFQKVREDQREVEYMFGFAENMDRRLVIQKETQEGQPLDGDRNWAFGAVLVKIVRYHRTKATWPERGVYAA